LIKIKIPKVDPNSWVLVKIYKMKYINFLLCTKKPSFRKQIALKPQTIAGLKIPKNSTINCIYEHINYDEILNNCSVRGEEVNRLLKYVFMENLRNKY